MRLRLVSGRPVCLHVCSLMSVFSLAELKRGVFQDWSPSLKLDKYKIAKQLTEKAIKVNAGWGLVGRGTSTNGN